MLSYIRTIPITTPRLVPGSQKVEVINPELTSVTAAGNLKQLMLEGLL